MTLNEYLLLEIVAERPAPVSVLARPEMVEFLGHPYACLKRDDLVPMFLAHFNSGYLIACQDNREFVPSDSQLNAALSGEQHIWYKLTAKGAILWEAIAKPQWQAYVNGHFDALTNSDRYVCEDTGLDRSRLERELEASPYRGMQPIPGTVIWDAVAPWEATYWKSFPRAQRLRFDFTWHLEGRDMSKIPAREWFTRPTFVPIVH
jgi:hypothetical protein